jgi:hypothetical protein
MPQFFRRVGTPCNGSGASLRFTRFWWNAHPVDLAMNKTMAAAGRREVRDLVDLVTIDETILPLGAVIWAAVGKAPGFTPEGLIAEIRRSSSYSSDEWRALMTTKPLDPKAIVQRLRGTLDAADAFVVKMPTDQAGLLFLRDGHVVQPDPARPTPPPGAPPATPR